MYDKFTLLDIRALMLLKKIKSCMKTISEKHQFLSSSGDDGNSESYFYLKLTSAVA